MDNYNFIDNINICKEVVNEASRLLYYSHIPTAFVALLIGTFVLVKGYHFLTNRLLFLITLCFTLWSIVDIMVWIQFDKNALVGFLWSLYGVLFTLTYIISFLLVVFFIQKKKISLTTKVVTCISFLPILLLMTTTFNIKGYDATNCVAIEGSIYTKYYLFLSLLYALAIPIYAAFNWRSIELKERKSLLILIFGLESFLILFFITVWGVGYLIDNGFIQNGDYSLEQYGLFGMPIFVAFLGYITVKHQAFNTKLIGSQALIIGLMVLVASQYFFVESTLAFVLTGITLALTLGFGHLLIKSVHKEVEQRVQIEELAGSLAEANARLKDLDKMKTEFVSIASHQLRSPLTSIRGYTSMLLEGSYGKLPVKAAEVISKISDSSKYMALSIEDYLNVSRIEAGNMRYELSDFNAKELVEKIVDEMRPIAIKKGLVMVFRSDCNGSCAIHADIGKTRQIVMNLLDNSMKYTPKGTITVVVHDNVKKKILSISVQDTGVGMSAETIDTLFEKFVRAKNANCVNVTGTGLGLYVAKKMTTEMGAKIWTESEGEGKGSTFHVEFALLPGKPKALK
jgi:signal transduction histidine kinase